MILAAVHQLFGNLFFFVFAQTFVFVHPFVVLFELFVILMRLALDLKDLLLALVKVVVVGECGVLPLIVYHFVLN